MIDYCYEFGRAVAQIKRDDFDMEQFIVLCRQIGMGLNYGSDGIERAMIGAFDEYRRITDTKKELYKE